MLTEGDKNIKVDKTTNILTIDASSTFPSNLLEEKSPPLAVTREKLALALVGIFAFTVLAAFLWLAVSGWLYSKSKENTNNNPSVPAKESISILASGKEIITLLLTTEAALVGSAMGFYFGERSGTKR